MKIETKLWEWRICSKTFKNIAVSIIVVLFTVTNLFSSQSQKVETWAADTSKNRSQIIGQNAIEKTKALPTRKKLLPKAIVSEGNPDRLQSVFAKAKKGGKLVIGVFGGSITAGASRPSCFYL